MAVAADSLCMGCMEPRRVGLCPNPDTCGWIEGAEGQSFPHLPPRTLLDNRYVLGRVLGQGGFGITYLAADLREYSKLALKEYFPSSFANRTADSRTVTFAGPANREPYYYGLKKFEEEGQTLQKFQNHPNIISVIRSFKANGTAYIVMEYVDGVTLLSYLSRQPGNRMPFDQALRILVPIMDALKEVHLAGVIHRDVSPDNIYLCRSGPIKLLDFGAARSALRDQTQSLQLILKPGYTPFEQYSGSGVVGPYTDVYSLGATMYRCITGEVPPEAPERLSEDDLRPPSELARLPAYADRALIKALAVRPRDRYPTIAEFQREVSPPPLPPSPDGALLRIYACWWAAGGVLMLAGSLLRLRGMYWFFWAGLVPATVGLHGIAVLWRRQTAEERGLGSLFLALAILGIVLTGFHPFGAILQGISMLVVPFLAVRQNPRPALRFGLRCVSGELAGYTIELGASPILIGRLPDLANVVIAAPEISGAHARVWTDPAGDVVWIEDLNSRNGTYFRRSVPDSKWLRVTGSQSLANGDRFCLCDSGLAAFQIECVFSASLRDVHHQP